MTKKNPAQNPPPKRQSLKTESSAPTISDFKPRPELLLHPNIPKPMHGLNPRNLRGQYWWDKTRKAAFERAGFHCAACGVHKSQAKHRQWLEGHEHFEIDYKLGRMRVIEIIGLCHFCHNFIHDGRLKNLLGSGEITQEYFDSVMAHGKGVLRQAGLEKPKPDEESAADLTLEQIEVMMREEPEEAEPMAAWSDWRLILDGEEYPPLWRDYKHWAAHYGHNVGKQEAQKSKPKRKR